MTLTIAIFILNALILIGGVFIMKMNTRITYLEEANGNLVEKLNRTKITLSALARKVHRLEKIVDPIQDFEWEYLQTTKQEEKVVYSPEGGLQITPWWRTKHDDFLGRK